MKINHQLMGLAGIAVAASLALSACDRQTDANPHVANSSDNSAGALDTPRVADNNGINANAPNNATTATGDTTLARNTPPDTLLGNEPTGAGMPSAPSPTAATAVLSSAEKKFLTDAASGGQYELAVAQLATTQATDSTVKSYAAMLVSDHTQANQKLAQLAQRHNVVLPSALPPEKQRVIDQLAKATGPEFDRQFIQLVGLHDHKTDISLFEKASREAKDSEVREFAASTLPTLRAHLSAAQNLPSSVKGTPG
jgi:putative membrane protein